MEWNMRLRIILEAPPPGVLFGLQEGRGSAYETVQKQLSRGGDLVFECTVRAKRGAAGEVDFTGECVQGRRGERFLYIDIGTYAGQLDSCWSRRLKIPLRGLPMDISAAGVWEARVPGMAKDGGPACATVQPVGGWQSRL
jgi:hypothetical protein